MTDTPMELEQFAARAVALFSRPTVAMELMRLAEEPRVDAQALKECISQDPALTCKVLRVVNSSLFGLPRPVADLTQAINRLGIKPLKLLVLGFNLPDALFAEVAARQLQWYWTNTLTRAVAARLICEQLWPKSANDAGAGDEAFIAGLLQDIGILVMLHELGEPYAKFLTGVIDENCHLALLEQDTLAFDHIQLSAALLGRWQLPDQLVRAIETPKRLNRLSRMSSPDADLPQILHLAELLLQLVGQRRLAVLPELLEAGKVYRGMTKSKLTALVEDLQPQVDQLADVLTIELTNDRDYVGMLVEAHRKMTAVSEEVVVELACGDDAVHDALLRDANELTDAMQMFLTGNAGAEEKSRSHAAHARRPVPRGVLGRSVDDSDSRATLLSRLSAAGSRCRERREELSLLLVDPNLDPAATGPQANATGQLARKSLLDACVSLGRDKVTLLPLGECGAAAIITDCERQYALAIARQAIVAFADTCAANNDIAATLSAGVATASVVPKNFEPARMVESALRCLAAARACGASAVKSIEV